MDLFPTVTYSEWSRRRDELTPRTQAFIDGEFRSSLSGATFPCIDPATDVTIAEVASCDTADIDLAVVAARRSFDAGIWANAAPTHRRDVLHRLADLIMDSADELALLDSVDMGKLVLDARTFDVPESAAIFEWYASAADKVYGEIAPGGPGNLILVSREALGVIGVVTPWNYPLEMATWKVAPALMAGNSVVLKPAEQSPLSAIRLAELAAEAGIPKGVFNVVPGFGETAGKALGIHSDVDCLSFTGSTEIGKKFLEYSALSNMKQVWPECGGKSPNVVFADASELSEVAEHACTGIFANQGEICSSSSRLLVERTIKDEFLSYLLEAASRWQPGDPVDPASTMGAIVDAVQLERVTSFIEDGRQSGDLLLGGDRRWINGRGIYVAPTIFDGVDPASKIATEEIFGPVLVVIAFDDEREAIALANHSRYGLAGSIWTDNLSKALRVANAMRVGTVTVNGIDAIGPSTPFGGFKESGFGRDLSLHALDKYTGLKTTWINYRPLDNVVQREQE